MSAGFLHVPVVFRGPNGYAAGVAAQHSQVCPISLCYNLFIYFFKKKTCIFFSSNHWIVLCRMVFALSRVESVVSLER